MNRKPHPPRTDRRRGLTLIEVLAALTLASIVLPVGLLAVTHAVRGAGQVRDRAVLVRVAENHLATLVATGDWQTGATSGVCDATSDGDDATGIRWQIAIDTWRDPTVRQLRLTVITPDEVDRLSLTTLVTAMVPE